MFGTVQDLDFQEENGSRRNQFKLIECLLLHGRGRQSEAPRQAWVFVSVERQSQLYVYKLTPDHGLARDPIFVKTTLAEPGNVRPAQAAGAIHVHPNGRFVYLTNRNSGTVELEGQKVSNGGENNVAVFAIDQASGEPKLIQNAMPTPSICARSASIRAGACWWRRVSCRWRCAMAAVSRRCRRR